MISIRFNRKVIFSMECSKQRRTCKRTCKVICSIDLEVCGVVLLDEALN